MIDKDDRILDSRLVQSTGTIRRRRQKPCGKRYTTYEVSEAEYKMNTDLQDFNKELRIKVVQLTKKYYSLTTKMQKLLNEV